MKPYALISMTFILHLMATGLSRANTAAIDIIQTDSARTTTTQTQVQETVVLETQAKRWSLDTMEYQRYLDLIKGPLGKWNPTIDPVLALGMFASNRQEQARYAELYAQQEFELTDRALQFQQAYRAAFKRLYPDAEILDKRLLTPYYEHQQQKTQNHKRQRKTRRQLEEGDRLLMFVPANCKQCQTLISRVMGLVSALSNGGVDIYVRNAHSDTAVRRWAQAHHIPENWLDRQNLTLNRDEGLYQRLQSHLQSPSSQTTPTATPIFLSRRGHYYQLNTREMGL